jgi:hypothetical protein
MSRPRLLPTVVVAGLLAAVMAAPAAADTNQFAGILDDGRLVRFTSQAPSALTTPLRPTGLVRGETLLAVGGHQGRLYGLGSSARVYAVDAVSGRATPVAGGRELTSGLRGRRFSLAISADGARARIVSDVGQDLFVDLASGAETPGPGVRGADGSEIRPAVSTAPDGRLVGYDAARSLATRETEPGSGVMSLAPLTFERNRNPFAPLSEPSSFAVAADGTGWALAGLSIDRRDRQSQVVSIDPASGRTLVRGDGVFLRRVVTIGALGRVPEDEAAPRAAIRVPRTMSVRRMIAGPLPLTVRVNEAGQALVSFRVQGARTGFGFTTRDTPGTYNWRNYSFVQRDRRRLRRAIGRRIQVVITTNDFNGNSRTVIRGTRLVR